MKVERAPEILDQRLDKEIIVVDLLRGIYFSLRDDLAEFWTRYVGNNVNLETNEDLEFARLLYANNLILGNETFEVGLIPETHEMLSKFTDLEDLLLADPIHDLGTQP